MATSGGQDPGIRQTLPLPRPLVLSGSVSIEASGVTFIQGNIKALVYKDADDVQTVIADQPIRAGEGYAAVSVTSRRKLGLGAPPAEMRAQPRPARQRHQPVAGRELAEAGSGEYGSGEESPSAPPLLPSPQPPPGAPPAAPALPVMPFGWLLVSHDVFPNASGWSGTDNETLFHCGASGEMLGSAHPSSLAVAGAYLQKSFDLGAQPHTHA